MRISPLRGAGTVVLKCPVPACGLTCRPTALAAHGHCPGCGHDRLIRLDLARGGRGAAASASLNRQAQA
ncbi:hypothetical protein B1H19_31235 [Streptomyces gilvosporeus]|uniref:Uncharacterized protein n=1 Tax=Streptomyces gilvosporeus TaxID=553510 RepID=A0A1V0TZ44_9ACTN|nr:hypothetical protein B1H19_31235 [Streptomyces gilvosporeus]